MSSEIQWVWHQGQLVQWSAARAHVTTHALHYGTAIFEGIRAHGSPRGPQFFRLGDHLRRFAESARLHRMQLPCSMEQVRQACHAVVTANRLEAAYVRPLAYYAEGPLGVPKADTVQLSVIPVSGALPLVNAELGSVKLGVSTWRRAGGSHALPAAKASGAYQSALLVAREAKLHGYDDGLMLDDRGCVCEATAQNLFLVRDGTILTPTRSAPILLGITRDTVLQLATALGYRVSEEEVPRGWLYTADELFLTGTSSGVVGVGFIDHLPVGDGGIGRITRELQRAYQAATRGESFREKAWLTAVEGDDAPARPGGDTAAVATRRSALEGVSP